MRYLTMRLRVLRLSQKSLQRYLAICEVAHCDQMFTRHTTTDHLAHAGLRNTKTGRQCFGTATLL